ncbi:hypothetical protein [Burkholderia savannae]|uniref:hypothetical protein n=1 Tax=Burkholderia savannae TaxID=1637837 RepID=UPI000A7AE479|nr:hypothetical protein [Burkholderia savannae]
MPYDERAKQAGRRSIGSTAHDAGTGRRPDLRVAAAIESPAAPLSHRAAQAGSGGRRRVNQQTSQESTEWRAADANGATQPARRHARKPRSRAQQQQRIAMRARAAPKRNRRAALTG